MPVQPFEKVKLGRTPLQVTRLGFGMVSLAGHLRARHRRAGRRRRSTMPGSCGIRYYDTAPLYGYTLGERRLGQDAPGPRPRDYTITTKVGRLMMPLSQFAAHPRVGARLAGARLRSTPAPRSASRTRTSSAVSTSGRSTTTATTASCARSSTASSASASTASTGSGSTTRTTTGSRPSAVRSRPSPSSASRVSCRSIGAGMNQAEMLARFAREGDFDAFMCAGRYTLLDQIALDELLPDLRAEGHRHRHRRRHEQRPAGQPDVQLPLQLRPGTAGVDRQGAAPSRPSASGTACRCVPPPCSSRIAHPVVACLVAGVRTIPHLDDTVASLAFPIPDALWAGPQGRGPAARGRAHAGRQRVGAGRWRVEERTDPWLSASTPTTTSGTPRTAASTTTG